MSATTFAFRAMDVAGAATAGEVEAESKALFLTARDGTVLMIQPGSGGAASTSWAGGRYRIDVLVAGGIHRIALQIPGRFGNVPPPDPWPAVPADLDPFHVGPGFLRGA